jgi:folate-binding protein YgfZ
VRELAPALLDGSGAPRPVGLEALERLRVERGVPRFGKEMGTDTFPQEAGVDDAVSYDKGCYLGQEVVARIHYRGGVQRFLVRIELEDGAGAAGGTLSFEGREAGRVTSTAPRFGAVGWAGMALVARRAAEPGTVLELADGRAARVLAPVSPRS